MGQLIEFYNPVPKAALTLADVIEAEPPADPSAEAVLKTCLERATATDQILILTCDKDGTLGFLGNCESLAESLLFMELVKQKMLFNGPTNGGIA